MSGLAGCDREFGFYSKLNILYIKVSSTRGGINGLFTFNRIVYKKVSFKINKNIQRITFSLTVRQTIIFVLTKKKMLSIVTVRCHLL